MPICVYENAYKRPKASWSSAYNFYKGYRTKTQEFQGWANFLYSKVIIGQTDINKEVKLKIGVSIIEFIKISLIYNSSYQERRLIFSGQTEPFFDYKEFVDEKRLNEVLPEVAYEERFIKENGSTLSGLGIANEDIKKIAKKFREQILDVKISQNTKLPRIFPIHLKQIIRFPIYHISERGDKQTQVFDDDSNPNFSIKAQLFKLHGSVNWYTKPNFGNYYYVPQGDNYLYKTELTDLQRLIVPPVANKSNLYEDSLFGAIWKGAYEKLKEADEVYFLGYSLPETDLQAKYLFQTGIKKDAKIFVVNKKGEENKYKNTFAGFANLNVEYCTADENPIKTFAENYEGFYS
jgi:hypothetical protein